MGGIPGLDLSDPKQLADFARYDLSGTRFDNGDRNDDEGGDEDLKQLKDLKYYHSGSRLLRCCSDVSMKLR